MENVTFQKSANDENRSQVAIVSEHCTRSVLVEAISDASKTSVSPSTIPIGNEKKSDSKFSSTCKFICFFMLAAAVLLSVVLSAFLLMKVETLLDETEILKQSISVLMNESENVKNSIQGTQADVGLLLNKTVAFEEKNDKNQTKIDAVIHQTETMQNECSKYADVHYCPSGGLVYNGVCYFAFMDQEYASLSAKQLCLENNAYPAFVENELMYHVLYEYLGELGAQYGRTVGYFWLGETYDLTNGRVFFFDGRESLWDTKWATEVGYPTSVDGHTLIRWYVCPEEDDSFTGFQNMPPNKGSYAFCQMPW